MDPESPEIDNVADLEQHCILFPTYATRYSRSGSKDPLDWNIRVRGWAFTKRSNRRKRLVMSMARKLAGVTKDHKVYETLESRFGMFLASNTQGARFTIQCIGPAKTNQMELASEHNLPDQSVEALMSDIKAPDAALAAAEAAEDKAQLRKSLQEDRGDLIREVKHEQHDHEYPSKAVEHAVDKFMRAKHPDVGDSPKLTPENDASRQEPPRSNERHEASFSDRWAKGAALMKGAYQKYKPMVVAHVNNSVEALNGYTRQESETRSYAGNASSTSSPSCATKPESGDSVMPQTDTYYEDLGYGNLPTVDISSVPGGHFDGTLRVSNEDIQTQKVTDGLTSGQKIGSHPRFLKLHAYHPNMADESVGTVNLIDPEGISVISDIDDTIKETNILAGATIVLRNTFLKEMRDVPGMADVYMKWWKHGAALHYVSNSPWQLIPSLLDFFRNHKFPPGSAHLRLTDSMLKTYFMTPGEHKRRSIREILTDFPQRKFILIGDSGEIDMEIYTQIAVDFPDQIFKIFIRDITTARLQEMAAKNNMAPPRSRSFTSSSTKTSIFAAATGFFSRHSDSSRTQTANVTEVNSPSSTTAYSTESGEERQEDTASFASMTIGPEQEDSPAMSSLNRQRSHTYSPPGSVPQDTPSKAPPLPPRDSSPAVLTSTTTTTTTTTSSSSPTSSSSSSATISTATTRATSTTDVAALDDEPMPGAPPPSDPVAVKSPLEVWMDRVDQCRKRLPEGMLTFFEDSSTLLEDPIVSGMILHHKESISDEEEQ